MTMTISLSPGAEARLKARAAAAGMDPTRYATELLESVLNADPESSTRVQHERMLTAAQSLVSDDSWFEEDFSKLRRAEK